MPARRAMSVTGSGPIEQAIGSNDAGVTGDPPIEFGALRNLGKQKTANLP